MTGRTRCGAIPNSVVGVFSAIMTSFLASVLVMYQHHPLWYATSASAAGAIMCALAYAGVKGIADRQAKERLLILHSRGEKVTEDVFRGFVNDRYGRYSFWLWSSLLLVVAMTLVAIGTVIGLGQNASTTLAGCAQDIAATRGEVELERAEVAALRRESATMRQLMEDMRMTWRVDRGSDKAATSAPTDQRPRPEERSVAGAKVMTPATAPIR